MTILQDRPIDAALSTAVRQAPANPARRAMIDSQLRVSGVTDPQVLAAIGSVAREDFVPEEFKASAYIDRAIPVDGHFLAAPLVHGRILTEAAPTADDEVLVVSPSGYLAAVIAAFGCKKVATISPAEAVAAKKNGPLATLILIDGAIEQLPAGLAARLAEGGRIVCGTVERGVTRLAVGRKAAGELSLLPLAEMGIPVLPEFSAPKRWSF